MSNIFKDISIYINHHPVLEPKRLDIATKIFEMYSLAVVQVLESVKQIEENLKRFKRKNTETKVSDEYKVRTQIKIDTMDFIEQIKSFGIENLGDGKEQDLVKLVNESLLN